MILKQGEVFCYDQFNPCCNNPAHPFSSSISSTRQHRNAYHKTNEVTPAAKGHPPAGRKPSK